MPKRKISIEEAFAVLEQAGIPIQVKPTAEAELVTEQTSVKPKAKLSGTYGMAKPIGSAERVSHKTTKVNLFAKHSVGSGGFAVIDKEGNKSIQSAGVQAYGPGICNVPAELASHLLHQDALAKQADDNMLDKTPRSYLVVQRMNSSGQRVNVGLRVSDDLFGNIGSLPDQYMHFLR